MDYFQKSQQEVLQELGVTEKGLDEQAVRQRREKYGPNALKQKGMTPLWKLFLQAWQDPMMLILAVVVIIQWVLGETLEAIVILAVLLVNSLLSMIQTKKAEGSLAALREISAPTAKVRRSGEVTTIPAAELVPGDIVILEAGDFVPADGRLLERNALKVDEGILTGESEPVLKTQEPLAGKLTLGDRTNMVYSGTMAVHGRGIFVVTKTGLDAEIGRIAALLESAEDRQTPLQRRLGHFSKRLGLWVLGLCVLIFLVQMFRTVQAGEEMQAGILSALMFAIAVAVAAIPEALSSIVTIVLAVGTRKMANEHAIIRKLPAVEALGSTGVICTDKTGTLTQNKMTVVDHFLPEEGALQKSWFLPAMALCNDAIVKPDGTQIGDPTETALLDFANKQGRPSAELRETYNRIAELPFDSERKLMSTLHNVDNAHIMLTKGAPDVLFARCAKVLVGDEVRPFGAAEREAFIKANEQFSERALRVLACAMKEHTVDTKTLCFDDEQGLVLIGLAAMIDPPREAVFESIARAKSAHIKTVMITGDHKTTAYAIAKEIGIAEEGDTAVTGAELDEMSEAELDEKLPSISVYARVSPENKIRIVKAWQRKEKITAMTGDGVNDAPSLKQADIGIAMGSGTEVSKDASAMILTDDNFVAIVTAVRIGRTIFDNIKKAIGYLFSGNLGGIIAILFALIAGWDKPLTALQILFINLVNDSIPAIALGLEEEEAQVMARPPRDMNEGIFGGGLFASVVIRGVVIGIATILAQFIGMHLFTPALGSAMAFTTLILTRTLQTFSARSNSQTMVKLGLFSNKYAVGAVLICLGLYATTLLPVMRGIFYIPETFGLRQWGIAAGLSVGAVAVIEISKVFRRKIG